MATQQRGTLISRARELISFSKSADNDGTSVWIIQGHRHSLSLMKSRIRGIPKLNQNDVYLVLLMRHKVSALGDKPQTTLKAHIWVGSSTFNHQPKVEKTIAALEAVVQEQGAKLRVYIDYQYSESFEFFAAFTPIDRVDSLGQTQHERKQKIFYALQYQEYVRDETAPAKERAVAFPKVLILEHISQSLTPLTSYIRIYERPCLDQYLPTTPQGIGASSLAFLILEGGHMNQQGKPVQSTAAAEPFSEVVQSGELVFGGHASKELQDFAATLCRSIETGSKSQEFKIDTAALSGQALPPKYQQMVERSCSIAVTERSKLQAKFSSAPQVDWPIVKCNAPFKIDSHSWKLKSRQELKEEIRDVNADPVIYEGVTQKPGQVFWSKRKDFMADFEPNSVNLFRVCLEPTFTGALDESEEAKLSADDLPQLFNLQLELLKVKQMQLQDLSHRHMYLLQTPVRLYIWLGTSLSPLKRQACLRVMQSFAKHVLDESFSYKPGYQLSSQKKRDLLSIRLRIETQGNESAQFASLLGKMKETPCRGSKMEYLMLHIPKINEDFDVDDEGEDDGVPSNSFLQKVITMGASKSAASFGHDSLKAAVADRKTSMRLRMSVKVNLRSTETQLQLNRLMKISKEKKAITEESKGAEAATAGLDMEEQKSQQDLVSSMRLARHLDQQKFVEKVRAKFNPLSILQVDKLKAIKDSTMSNDFDAIWQFEILGRRFEQIENPLKVGVLDSAKCYFVVFFKSGRVAITLWRGKDQTHLDFKKSVKLFKQTKFRLEKAGIRKKGNRSKSNVDDLKSFLDKGGNLSAAKQSEPIEFGDAGKSQSDIALKTINTERMSQELGLESKKQGIHTKFVFSPIDQVQQTVDPRKIRREHSLNLESLKRDEHMTEVNLRQFVQQDHEPMTFLQALQGAYIVTTNEYLQREPQTFDQEGEFQFDDDHYLMMFQILGVPSLNQRAREVAPFKTSLTTSGLYMLITRRRILFWAGSEFFASYLTENWSESHSNIIGEELLTKIVYLYDQSQSLVVDDEDVSKAQQLVGGLEDKKVSYYIEGCENEVWQAHMKEAVKSFNVLAQSSMQPKSFNMPRSTFVQSFQRMRTETFRRAQIAEAAEHEDSEIDDEDSDEAEDGLSEDFGSSDENIELFDFENEITSKLWLPAEPHLFCIYNGRRFVNYNDEQDLVNRQAENVSDSEVSGSEDEKEDREGVFNILNTRTHSEYMTMKQTNRFSQDSLRSASIYMIDHESEVFIWVGSKVPGEIVIDSIQKVGQAAHSVHGKGKQRRDKISFSFVRQGFEPEIFKNIFPRWEPFSRVGLDEFEISEDDEESDSDSSGSDGGNITAAKKGKGDSTAATTEAEDPKQVSLTSDQKKTLTSYLSESVWINF